MKKIIACMAALLPIACSPLKSSPNDEKHQLELTLHELQTNFDDVRHDLNCFQTEMQILDGRIKYYENAHRVNPDELSVLSSLALAYNSNKQYKESDAAYEEALKLDPDNALILNNYAYNLSTRNQDLNKALDMIKRAVRKEPGNPSYLDTMGWIYYMLKDYKAAKEYIERAVSVNGSNSVLLEHLGDVHNALKDTQKAVYFWKKALELNKGNKQLEEKINFLNQ